MGLDSKCTMALNFQNFCQRLGWSATDKPSMPGRGVLGAPTVDAAARGGAAEPEAKRQAEQEAKRKAAAEAREFWEGWAVDVRLELASLLFPTGLMCVCV